MTVNTKVLDDLNASKPKAEAEQGNQPEYNIKILWLICLVAAMGGFLFGYDWVVVGGAKSFYEP